MIGLAAARQQTTRIANLQRMLSYARSVHRTTGEASDEIRLPGLPDARSQLAAPMVSRGVLIGVLAIESNVAIAYDELDERVLTVAARLVAAAFDREQMALSDHEPPVAITVHGHRHTTAASLDSENDAAGAPVVLRHYAVDGSTFLGDQYVIKGVAGRLLWKVVSEQVATGRTSFTNREAKLDKTLELPEYRDNFESRLILLKRRLEEHDAPIRIHSTGRGRFDVELGTVRHARLRRRDLTPPAPHQRQAAIASICSSSSWRTCLRSAHPCSSSGFAWSGPSSVSAIASSWSWIGFELGESASDRQHRGSVASECDDLTGFGSSVDEAEAMFDRVVTSTSDVRIDDIGRTPVTAPLVEMIDLGVVHPRRAARVPAMARHQLGRHPGRTLEQASLASHVEHHPVAVDDHPPDVAEQRRLQHMFGWHDDAIVGLATGPGQIGQRQIVGERDQSVPGEQRLERLDVAHDVDDRLRSTGTGGHRRRRPKDPQ